MAFIKRLAALAIGSASSTGAIAIHKRPWHADIARAWLATFVTVERAIHAETAIHVNSVSGDASRADIWNTTRVAVCRAVW
jgi:hypothetical protein